MASALIVSTSLAGHGGPEVTRAVSETLAAAGWTVVERLATDRPSLRRFAEEGVATNTDVVVAIGGDGTAMQVADALVGTQVALGIVPTGTGNLLAGNLDLARHPVDAVRSIVSGRARRIDLGRVSSLPGTPHFAVAAGVGFDARVMNATPAWLKRRLGKLAYVVVAATLGGTVRNVEHEVIVDGRSICVDAAQVLVANFGRLAPHVHANWAIEPDDGLLDIVVVPASAAVDGIAALWDAVRPRFDATTDHGRIIRLRGRDVRVMADRPQQVEVDGDVAGWTPLAASVVPAALSVMVPTA